LLEINLNKIKQKTNPNTSCLFNVLLSDTKDATNIVYCTFMVLMVLRLWFYKQRKPTYFAKRSCKGTKTMARKFVRIFKRWKAKTTV